MSGSSPLEEFARHQWGEGDGDTAPPSALPRRGDTHREYLVSSGPATRCHVALPARLEAGPRRGTWCTVRASRQHGGPTLAARLQSPARELISCQGLRGSRKGAGCTSSLSGHWVLYPSEVGAITSTISLLEVNSPRVIWLWFLWVELYAKKKKKKVEVLTPCPSNRTLSHFWVFAEVTALK